MILCPTCLDTNSLYFIYLVLISKIFFEISMSLISIKGRETEYYRVVSLALMFGKPKVALEAAGRLASVVNRERAFWMVFSHLLQKGDTDGAERVISMLSSIVNRERARHMLMRESWVRSP